MKTIRVMTLHNSPLQYFLPQQ